LREHNGTGGERNSDADLREPLPEDASPSQQEKQRNAADNGRQYQRDSDRRPQEAARQDLPVNGMAQQDG